MRRETILKAILVIVIGMMLVINPLNVFATSNGGKTDLNDILGDFEDQGGLEDLKQEQTPSTTPPTTTPSTTTPETQPSTTKPTTPEKEEKLPEAGLAEDTMMFVAIVALGATAIFALKKVNEYNNI